ncbi:MAG: Exonuclease small subunit [Candidatus Parcubacteria bacterium]|jgi:exodeoxyribonuclease VII small subunit
MTKSKDINLNDAFLRLEQITALIESEDLDLEKSIPLMKEGLELAKYIKLRLTALENEIEEIKTNMASEED